MNGKQIGLGSILLSFSILTAYAVYLYGYVGFFREVTSNMASLTLLVDLVIALTIILAYMGNDAREQGISAVPYLLLTLAFGSVGPLLYLIRRLGKATARLPRTARTSNA